MSEEPKEEGAEFSVKDRRKIDADGELRVPAAMKPKVDRRGPKKRGKRRGKKVVPMPGMGQPSVPQQAAAQATEFFKNIARQVVIEEFNKNIGPAFTQFQKNILEQLAAVIQGSNHGQALGLVDLRIMIDKGITTYEEGLKLLIELAKLPDANSDEMLKLFLNGQPIPEQEQEEGEEDAADRQPEGRGSEGSSDEPVDEVRETPGGEDGVGDGDPGQPARAEEADVHEVRADSGPDPEEQGGGVEGAEEEAG